MLTDPFQSVVTALLVLIRARDTVFVSFKLFTVLRMVEASFIVTFLTVSPLVVILVHDLFSYTMAGARSVHQRFLRLLVPSFSFNRPLNVSNNFWCKSSDFSLVRKLFTGTSFNGPSRLSSKKCEVLVSSRFVAF